jgi:hypothetical protein
VTFIVPEDHTELNEYLVMIVSRYWRNWYRQKTSPSFAFTLSKEIINSQELSVSAGWMKFRQKLCNAQTWHFSVKWSSIKLTNLYETRNNVHLKTEKTCVYLYALKTYKNIYRMNSLRFYREARGSVVVWGIILQAGRSRVRFAMRWIFFFFNLPNHSGCAMNLGSTQPLTEMSTKNLPGGKARSARKADNLTAICEPTV